MSGSPARPEPEDAFLAVSDWLWARAPGVAHGLLNKFTPAGRVLTLAFIPTAAVAAGLGIHVPLYYFGLLLLMLSCVDWFAGWLLRPRVEVARELPERCAAGATVVARHRVTNRGRLPALDVCVTERRPPPGLRATASPYLARIEPGATVELVSTLQPARRGAYDLVGPVVLSAFPFGIYQLARTRPLPQRMLVYPRFAPLAAVDLPVGPKHQPGGLALVSKVGDSEEFLGNREYRPGDRLRDLDQRAWARRGTPIVREHQQEYLCRIALVVDSHVPRGDLRGLDALEAAISLGAAVADALSRMEYVVDLFAVGPDLYHLQAGRSLAYLDTILDILACLEPCREDPMGALAPALREEVSRISSAVVVLLDWDEPRARFVRSLTEVGVAVKVVVVRHGPPSLDPGGAASEVGPVQVLEPAAAAGGVDRL